MNWEKKKRKTKKELEASERANLPCYEGRYEVANAYFFRGF